MENACVCYKKLENSYLYHKARKCHFASASTCKTFSSRVIHKIIQPTIYLRQNIIIFVKKLPDREFIFLPLET
jgi:hypothetical protein